MWGTMICLEDGVLRWRVGNMVRALPPVRQKALVRGRRQEGVKERAMHRTALCLDVPPSAEGALSNAREVV